MPALIDLTGQKFNRLTVLSRDYSKNQQGRRGTFWLCECDCGNQIIVASSNLKNGNTKSCGCLQKEKAAISGGFIDLTGQTFGRLTVIKRAPKQKNSSAYWECSCLCGVTTIVSGRQLRSGKTLSCGCLRLEKLREACGSNITGQRFGHLVALEIDNSYKKEKQINNRKLYWKCQCDCGAIVSVEGTHLRRGETQSCGCIISRGEERIANILSQNNIPYEKQKTFNSCVFDNGLMARFDFYINNQFLVEFDGLQHFKPGCFNQDKEAFIAAQQRDIFKNNWCLINNIPLKRIPYDALDVLSLEDIMGDKFLIERIK